MKKSERLQKVIEYYAHGNKSEFGRMLGLKSSAIGAWLSRETFDVELIATKCGNLNLRWLITGEGEMFEHRQARVAQSAPSSENNSTPSPASSPAPSSAPIPANLTQVMNEFLTISHTLTQQIAEGQRILMKSQQLYEQAVALHKSAPRPYTSQDIMASEPNEQYKTK